MAQAEKDLIKQIQVEEFGLDPDLPEKSGKAAQSLRRKLNKALRILSDDLYSKEPHFALELLQNADDNAYADNVEPSIEFQLSASRLVIRNNECGFTADNVRALCSIGDSTKTGLGGYIGEKGIGFKSVFKVTNRPEIHSNGFHFCFDRSDGTDDLGFVVPHWCDELTGNDGRTTIVLPARPGTQFASSLLEELQGDLLLFLRKIRKLRVDDEITGSVRTLTRVDAGGITTLASTRRFKRFVHKFSTAKFKNEKRPNEEDSELVLALPLEEDGSAKDDVVQPVFAFLPVREYGFRFIIHGDFLLVAARDDIHRTKPWNTNVRDQIGKAFVGMLPEIQRDEALARAYLKFVPRKGDVTDSFFSEAEESIVSALKDAPSVRSVTSAWRKPNQLLLADEQFQKLIPNDLLSEVLGLEYLSADFDAPTETLERIGVVRWSIDHLLKILARENFLQTQPISWFANLYQYCGSKITNEAWRKKLRDVAFIKLVGGALGKLTDGEIFFPLDKSRRYGFEADLRVLDSAVLESENDLALIRSFLEKMGVKGPSIYNIVIEHILRKHAARPLVSTRDALIGHVKYIKDNRARYLTEALAAGELEEQALGRLRSGLLLASKKRDAEQRTTFVSPIGLYLSTEYSPNPNIEQLMSAAGNPERFIDPDYLPERLRQEREADTKCGRLEWREFLFKIGANSLPNVESSGTDWIAGPELGHLLKADDAAVRKPAVEFVDQYWTSYYARFAWRSAPQGQASQFLKELRATLVPIKRGGVAPLSDGVLDCDDVRAVFGNSVQYLDMKVSNEAFLDAVGVIRTVNASACIKRLNQLRQSGKHVVHQVRPIYRQLHVLLAKEADRIRAGFSNEPLIYAPSQRRWLTTTQVVWHSSSPFLDSMVPPLASSYREFETFFRKVGVAAEPSETAVIDALDRLKTFGDSPQERADEALRLYKRLSRALRAARAANPKSEPDWLMRMRSSEVFLDQQDRMIEPSNDLYINDSWLISEAFKAHSQVSIVNVSPTQLPQIEDLLEACSIPRISASASHQLISAEAARPDDHLTDLLRSRTPHVMRVVYRLAHAAFERASADRIWSELASSEVRRAKSLQIQVTLAEHSVPLALEKYRNGSTIYLTEGIRSPLDRIAFELCRWLHLRDDLADTLHRILSAHDDIELEDYFADKGYPDVPDEVIKEASTAVDNAIDVAEDKEAPTGKEGAERGSESGARQPNPENNTREGADAVEDGKGGPRKEASSGRGSRVRSTGASGTSETRGRGDYSTGGARRPGAQDRRSERGEKAESWFGDKLSELLPAEWSLGSVGGGGSPFDFEILNGERRVLIEVKTDSASFFLTENEVMEARDHPGRYVVVLVDDSDTDGVDRSIRWIFDPIAECATWVVGGAWVFHKESSADPKSVVAWNVPEPRPTSTVGASFRFQVSIPPAKQVLPSGWQPFLQYLTQR